MSLPAAPLAEADAHARAALARLDAGAHDLDAGRVVLLREALAELRHRFSTLGKGRWPEAALAWTVMFGGFVLAAFGGLQLHWHLSAPAYVLVFASVPVAAVCSLVFITAARFAFRPALPRPLPRLPEPDGDLPGHLDEVVGILRGAGPGRSVPATVVHAEICAARAWSLANGGLGLGRREAEPTTRRTPGSRRLTQAMTETSARLSQLAFRVRDEAAAADVPGPALHLLARYDLAGHRLDTAVRTLRGPASQWTPRIWVFTGALWVVAGTAVLATPSVLILPLVPMAAGLGRAAGLRIRGLFEPKRSSLPAERRATLAAVEKHLTDVARLPGAAAAQAAEDLRVAREALAES